MKSIKNLVAISLVVFSFACMQITCMNKNMDKKDLIAKLEKFKGQPVLDVMKFIEKELNVKVVGEQILADPSKTTPLMNAALSGEEDKIAAELAAHQGDKAYINKQDTYTGNTALHLAAATNHPEIVKLLVAAKADLTIVNGAQQTARKLAETDQDCAGCATYLKLQHQAAKRDKKAAEKRKEKAKVRKRLLEEQKKKAEKGADLQTPSSGEKQAKKPADLRVKIPETEGDFVLVNKPSPRAEESSSTQD
jgi:hypothetical protein